MEEPTEELEPLFDYSRVQPENFFSFDDSDLEKSPIFANRKRRKMSDAGGKGNGKVDCEDVVVLDEGKGQKKVEDEDDWLPPPPPKVHNAGLELEDKTLQELRLKKQELASFARSAQDVLKDLVETARKELDRARKPAEEGIMDMPSKPKVERQKIVISIQDTDGQKQFRIYADDSFEKLFKLYAEKVKLKPEDLVFCFDGDKVSPTATPKDLALEDDDMIEVNVKLH
ncbi:uncharacterized protein [Typha angustifolia]|uniref:uncharacterized protein n=1 Tax=Typha angustifolia TaxID=59011 RepID=UPI003C2BFED3